MASCLIVLQFVVHIYRIVVVARILREWLSRRLKLALTGLASAGIVDPTVDRSAPHRFSGPRDDGRARRRLEVGRSRRGIESAGDDFCDGRRLIDSTAGAMSLR